MTTEIDLKNNTMNHAEDLDPKKWAYKCPVCKKGVTEETQTKCGHVFCRRCIEDAIKVHGRCPACKSKSIHGDLRRIYFKPDAKCDIDPQLRSLIIREKEIAMRKKKPSFF